MSIEEMTKSYLIKECDVVEPNASDIKEQIESGIKFYGSEEKYIESMQFYFGIRRE